MIPNPAGKVNYCCAAKVQTKYQVCVKPLCIQCFVVHLYWRDFIWYCVVENIAHIYKVIAQQFYVKADDRISDLDLLLYTKILHS